MVSLQIESGFFHESDVKIVAKSIRDRVALIQWRRERIRPDNGDTEGMEQMNVPQIPLPPLAHSSHIGQHEGEELETDQHLFLPKLPASITSVACMYLLLTLFLIIHGAHIKGLFTP